jgi:hypothetical protein
MAVRGCRQEGMRGRANVTRLAALTWSQSAESLGDVHTAEEDCEGS